MDWDDWRVLGGLAANRAGPHGKILACRGHHRLVHSTSEVPSDDELASFERYHETLRECQPVKVDAKKSWYKFQREEIRVRASGSRRGKPLARSSPVVNGLKTVNQRRVYVPVRYRSRAQELLGKVP